MQEHVEELAGDKELLGVAMATPWLSYYGMVSWTACPHFRAT